MIFIKITKIIFQIKNENNWSYFKLTSTVTELFLRGKKRNIALPFITQSYFAVPKNFRLNSTHCFVMKIPNKKNL